jgi:FkbM family methyltransferase
MHLPSSLSASLKQVIKRPIDYLLGRFNWELQRKHTPVGLLRAANLRTVIDGGANDGGFAKYIRAISPDTVIHSFEPVPWIHEKLKSKFKSDHKFHAYPLALSNENDKREFEINSGQYSSSLLPVRADAAGMFWGLGHAEKRISVEVSTLDQWARGQELFPPMLLKLDIEGNELAALEGANELLSRTDYVLTEISFIDVRHGQPTFKEIVNFLAYKGFDLIDVFPGNMDKRTGRAVWADVLFARSSLAASKAAS